MEGVRKKLGEVFFNFVVLRHLHNREQISAQENAVRACCLKLINQFFRKEVQNVKRERCIERADRCGQ